MAYELLPTSPDAAFMPCIESPMAYHVDAPWGSIQVTEDAHHAYEISPSQTVEAGPAGEPFGSRPESDGPRIDIILAGPGEMTEITPIGDDGFWCATGIHRNGVAVAAGHMDDKSTQLEVHINHALEAFRSTLPDDADISDEELEEQIVDFDGHPLRESLAHTMPEAFTAHLASNVHEALLSTTNQWQHARSNEAFTNKTMAKTLGGIFIGGPVIATSVLLGRAAEVLIPSAYTAAYGATLAVNSIRYVLGSSQRQRFFTNRSHRYAGQAAQSLFELYSSEHFDQNFGPRLED
jgi:hypothetical protein